ncbi:MAG: hypothetical protein SNI70_09535 [Rikenellaceae bacterium]
MTGQAREADGGKNYEAASIMQANDDEENSYQIRRSLSNAFSALKSLLGEYLVEEKTTSDNLIDQEIDDDGELTLLFELPSNFNSASADSLGDGIHSYLVDRALGDWFAITNKDDAEIYIAHSTVSLDTVKRSLYKRSRPERPTYDN